MFPCKQMEVNNKYREGWDGIFGKKENKEELKSLIPKNTEEALNRYGHHDKNCEEYDVYSKKPCTCGFNEALKKYFINDKTV